MLMVTERFVGLAKAVAKGRGLPDLPMVILPADVEQMSPGQLERVGREALDKAAQLLAAAASTTREHK
jgi:hypothetical protein